jgi:hypothetical protein
MAHYPPRGFCVQVVDGQIELWDNQWKLKASMGTSKFDKAVSERGNGESHADKAN